MIRIGITHGDINGVGYELILKTLEAEEMLELFTPVIYGSPKAATFHRKAIDSQTSFIVRENIDQVEDKSVNMINCFGEDELKIEFGHETEESKNAAKRALEFAIEDLKKGKIDALVTAPTSGVNLSCQQIQITGNLRIGTLADKVLISDVAKNITKEKLTTYVTNIQQILKRDFLIDNPRIAVLNLNPVATDESEEATIIKPAVDEMFANGVRCFGPYQADEFFGSQNYKHFDAVVSMYHDQGFVASRILGDNDTINYAINLPIVITSPACGPMFDIAGKGTADETSLRQSIYTAIDTLRHRREYDSAHSNPLRRQYFEKRDDSDKIKLDTPEE